MTKINAMPASPALIVSLANSTTMHTKKTRTAWSVPARILAQMNTYLRQAQYRKAGAACISFSTLSPRNTPQVKSESKGKAEGCRQDVPEHQERLAPCVHPGLHDLCEVRGGVDAEGADSGQACTQSCTRTHAHARSVTRTCAQTALCAPFSVSEKWLKTGERATDSIRFSCAAARL